MKLSYTILSLIGLSFLIIGCTTSGQSSTQLASNFINRQHVVATTKESYAPKNPKNIALYAKNEKPLSPYRIIGIATVSKHNLIGMQRQDNTLHEMMKKLAASIGGDALINISDNTENMQASIIQFQRILI